MSLVEGRSLNVPGKSGKWSWLDEDSLRIESSEAAYKMEATVKGDTLIIRDKGFGGNAVVTFARDLSKKRSSAAETNKKLRASRERPAALGLV